MATAIGSKAVHDKAAAFDDIAERIAEQVFKRFNSGALDLAMSLLLRQRGWTCTPPAEQPPAEQPKPAPRRKKARG